MGCAARIIEPTLAEIVAINGRRPAGGRQRGRYGQIQPSSTISSPTQITSATKRSWHRADLGVTIGTGVSGWVDQFGNGYDVAQASGPNQPTVDTLDGQTALRFTRASSQLLLLTDSGLVNAIAGGTDTAYTAYIVFSKTGSATTQAMFWLGSSASTTTYTGVYVTANPGVLHHERRDGVGADTDATMSGATVTATTPYLLRVRFDGANASYILNGTTLTPSVPNDVGALSIDRFAFGAVVSTLPAGSTFLDGWIAECVTATGLVSTAEEAELVANYFTPRYPSVS